MKGADYSWDRPDLNCLWGQGVRFIVRYGSRDPSKNLTKAELDKALAVGMGVCVVWQEGKTQMERGYSGGQTDARDADAFVNGLGLKGIPVYFSCDQDYEATSSSVKSAIDAYCDGAKSIVGLARMGGYGDDTFCKRMFDTSRITWGWQTYAWSEGMWESRCQLRQVKNNQSVCGGYIDWDESMTADYGQWPRPGGSPAAAGTLTSAVCFDRDGNTHMACVWEDGKVNYRMFNRDGTPANSWAAVDPGSNARGGVDIAMRDDYTVIITYINQGNKVCVYESQPHHPGTTRTWAWADRGGPARA